jgi:hypothetical protein
VRTRVRVRRRTRRQERDYNSDNAEEVRAEDKALRDAKEPCAMVCSRMWDVRQRRRDAHSAAAGLRFGAACFTNFATHAYSAMRWCTRCAPKLFRISRGGSMCQGRESRLRMCSGSRTIGGPGSAISCDDVDAALMHNRSKAAKEVLRARKVDLRECVLLPLRRLSGSQT